MREKLVSVIMSIYNEENRWLYESIESIINQSYPYLEIILVLDNPRNLEALELVSKYAKKDERIHFIKNKENIGLAKSLNIALQKATGYYIARMDADDISMLNRIEKEIEILHSKDVDFVMASTRLINEEGNELPEQPSIQYSPEAFAEIIKYRNISAHPTWLLKKSVYDRLGGYRDIHYDEDSDFIFRAVQSGVRCYRMNDIVLSYRIRNTGISKTHSLEMKVISRYLRNAYRKGVAVEKLDPEVINNLFFNFTKREKSKYLGAEKAVILVKKKMLDKKIMSSIGLVVLNYFSNQYFRDILNNHFRWCFLVRKSKIIL